MGKDILYDDDKFNDKDYIPFEVKDFFRHHAEFIKKNYDNPHYISQVDELTQDITDDIISTLDSVDGPPPEMIDTIVKSFIVEEGVHQRMSDRYLFVTKKLRIQTHIKKDFTKNTLAPWLSREKEIDFDYVGLSFLDKFISMHVEHEFGSEEEGDEELLESVKDMSFEKVRYMVESYLNDKPDYDTNGQQEDDEDEDYLNTLSQGEDLSTPLNHTKPWHAYVLASALLWKTETDKELETAVMLLADATDWLQLLFLHRQDNYVMSEFHNQNDDAFGDRLRNFTCDTAGVFGEQLADTYDRLCENKECSEELIVLYENIISSLCTLEEGEEKWQANENLYELYDDIHARLMSKDNGDEKGDLDVDI